MEFSADDIANHSDNLNAIGNAAVDDLRLYCSDLFSGVDWSDADDDTRKQLRNQVIDHVNYIQETYGSASESIGSLFFDNALSSDGELANAVMAGTANSQQVSNSVRYWARHLFGEDPDLDAFVDVVSAFVRRTVTHAADLSVAESAVSTNEQKDLGIRYARVPQGPTCAFCILLASRGFVYASRESAGEFNKFHDDCNCRIVAGMPGTEVEGYDPDGMYDRYNECRKALTCGLTGEDDPIWRDWNKLTPDEQAAYADEKGVEAYDNYVMRRIVSEMRTRDKQWLYDGTPPEIDYSLNPRSNYGKLKKPNDYSEENIVDKGQEWRDLYAIDTLQKNGFNVSTRPNNCLDDNGRIINEYTTPDLLIGNTLWEIKSPRESAVSCKPGNELKFIDNQFKEARHNFVNPFDPNTKGPVDFYDGKRRVVLNLKYRKPDFDHSKIIKEIEKAMKNRGISEVIYIDDKEGLFHIKL